MDTENNIEEENKNGTAVFLEIIVTLFLAAVFLFFLVKFLFF